MPDNVDTMFSVRERPWHGKGVILDRHPVGVKDALHQSGMDWEVDIKVLYIPVDSEPLTVADFNQVQQFRAVVRMDTNTVLGIVGTRFTPVQNIEAFQFLDNLLGTDMLFETAGALGRGERVWVLSKIPDYITVGGDVVDQFVLFTNSHDGKSAVTVLVTPIRVVCQNTLSLAISKAGKNKYTFRHVGNTTEKLHQAREVLEIAVDYGKQFKKVGDTLATVKFSDDQLVKVLDEMYGPAETDRAVTNLEAVKNSIINIAHGKTAGNAEGTKWGGLNAICEYMDYYRPTRGESDLFARINFEPTNPKQKAYDLIVKA